MIARCSCGALKVTVPGPPQMVIACHCLECQRRTGSAFGLGAFYPSDAVTVAGASKVYSRHGESGGKVNTHFCPECGTSLFWRAERLPEMIAVAVGAFENPAFCAPAISTFERSKHSCYEVVPTVMHYSGSARG